MISSTNLHIYSSNEMLAAGFIYINRGDTTRCVLCELEVSEWTFDMDPLTIHVERSPLCAFVHNWLPLNKCQKPTPLQSPPKLDLFKRASKRQKTEVTPILYEVDKLKKIRHRSFYRWPHSTSFRSRMVEAGFFSCNIRDRVICIYCDLICQEWNIELDDPCEVHTILSPNCLFVKYIPHCDASHDKRIVSKLPSYMYYVDPEKRQASFSNHSYDGLQSIDKLVDGGFFYDGTKVICFYCSGSFDNEGSSNHPIAEHLLRFPYCQHARQLCGEELYHKLIQSTKYTSENLKTRDFIKNQYPSNNIDDEILLKLVDDSLGLPTSKYLLELQKFERSILEHCWKDLLQQKNCNPIDICDLYFSCEIFRKQCELIEMKQKDIIVPNIVLKEFYENKRNSSFISEYPLPSNSLIISNGADSYMMDSFESDLEIYRTNRQKLANTFMENIDITIEREKSLSTWSLIKPSRFDLTQGGWVISETDGYSKCPHCQVHYCNWNMNDNPLLIHKYLSPLCLFVLSPNPFNSNPIPIRKIAEHFTDEDIINAESQPYNGLVQQRHEWMSSIFQRQNSFQRYPGGCPTNAYELAKSGFYYTNHGRFITCFYCRNNIFAFIPRTRSDRYLEHLPHLFPCRYIQQFNDVDSESWTHQVSNKCTWCMVEKKRLMALPCRHFCLCESCGQVKRSCPVCQKNVTVYIIIYLP
ncbi:unnamed protein product [Rotaria socialis]|uniref:RING-type domain-containing protein n=1 Tax=Rotaria socialis TaxID=392032 RepID=A0A817WWV4_9BILA|nr:unnamed protein product [Rotaria socialis]CAF4648525.1 unnamed protein product [Rotaria socialis]